MSTWITGGKMLSPAGQIDEGYLRIQEGLIESIGSGLGAPQGDDVVLPAQGLYVAPGFVDTHIHGIGGYDAMAGIEGVKGMSLELVKRGVTAFLPTLVSTSPRELIELVGEISQTEVAGADMPGLHLEGPFLDTRAAGMFVPDDFRPFNTSELENLARAGDGFIRIMTIACQGTKSDSLPRLNMVGIIPSLGHAAGSYEDACMAIDRGLVRCTHCFNAMTGIHHRAPGIAGAILLHDQVMAELILDGKHVHPAVARLLYRIKGASGIILVSDSILSTGLGDGRYMWRDYEIMVSGGVAKIPEGNLSGSVLTLDQAVKNAVEMLGIPVASAVEMASLTPAKSAGLADSDGSLAPGRRANIVLLDDATLNPVCTMIGGTVAWASDSFV